MGTDVRSDAFAKLNVSAGKDIFRALDRELIKYMENYRK